MANKYHFKKQVLSFAMQKILLDKSYPEAQSFIKSGTLIWYGAIKPTPLSRTYSIKIVCKKKSRPKVILYGDNIEGLANLEFPHHFKIDKDKKTVELCLHLWHEFTYSDSIADTIIPWTQEWLYFYEIWLATGEWCGGGQHPR